MRLNIVQYFPATHENSKRLIIFLYACFLPFEHHFRVLADKMIHIRPIMICEYFIPFQPYFCAPKENRNLHVSDADVSYFQIEMLKGGAKYAIVSSTCSNRNENLD